MPNRLVVGTQWGDEGKGKIVDLLAASADWVARYSGGANAGHTVQAGSQHFALHLIPTGILSPRTRCLIGNGVVVDLPKLFEELGKLASAGIDATGRLFVSGSAHLVLPHHKLLEAHAEAHQSGADKIGTTMRGIGPAYADKIARRGVRAADVIDEGRLRRRVEQVIGQWGGLCPDVLRAHDCSIDSVMEEIRPYRERLVPMLVDASVTLTGAMRRGESILFEGAQGTMLDIDFGTYPFVTSSNTTTGGVLTGLGVPPTALHDVIGVVKAYTTRVGNGPFPTEQKTGEGKLLQERGNEFGTTTGRSRRCGWLDLVQLRYAVRVNGITHIAVTKLDVLDLFAEIPICLGYEIDGETVNDVPMDTSRLGEVVPVYKIMPGWNQPTAGVTEYDDLPPAAREYLEFVCDALGVKLLMVSTGPDRAETVWCDPRLHTTRV